MKDIAKYAAVFGRPPLVLREPIGRWNVSACMFPAMKPSFWKGLWNEAHDQTIYITAGMSDHLMPGDVATRENYAGRVELMAVCDRPIGGGPSGTEEVPTAILQMIAEYVLENELLVGVGHTLDFQEPLAKNTPMTAVLFATPEGMDTKRILRCTKAQELLSIVPITAMELEFLRTSGIGALLDRFETSGVRPVFDYARASAV